MAQPEVEHNIHIIHAINQYSHLYWTDYSHCKLYLLLQVLQDFDSHNDSHGGHILLISDGMQNNDPNIEEVKPSLISNGVTVHSILYSEFADPAMEALSQDTGGKSFYNKGTSDDTTELLEGLQAIVEVISESQKSGNITAFSPKVQVGMHGL